MRKSISIPLGGLSDLTPNGGSAPTFGESTSNFYPNDEGYLVNYPGKTDYFHRGLDEQDFPWKGVPPSLATITRVFAFKDYLGSEHVVFVQGANVCEKYGNGYRVLCTLTGSGIGDLFWPNLFLHQSKLIILNFGDPPLIWDGIDGVEPVGVTEVPQAPDTDATVPPGCGDTVRYGMFAWGNQWWPRTVPVSGPSGNADSLGDPIDGIYSWRLQFQDRYGNKGRVGGPSSELFVPQQVTISIPASGELPDASFIKKWYATIDWMPPLSNPHIHYTILGRTPNLVDDDPQGGIQSYNLFYNEMTFEGTTYNRHVSQMNDTVLLSLGAMDMEVGPPPTSSIGCSWNGRIFIAGLQEDHVVMWSDTLYFGQFRGTQLYSARDRVQCVIPAGDRLLIITESSVETLYESQAGISILQVDYANGSRYGRSFVDVGGAVFGLFNSGFGFHDGQGVKYVTAPYWLKSIYQDPTQYITGAVKWHRFYIVSFSLYAVSRQPNRLVMFDISQQSWFSLNEITYDLTLGDDGILGCDLSIFQLFKGRYPASTLELQNMIPNGSGFFESRAVLDAAFLMWPSSKLPLASISFTATGSDQEGILKGAESLMPSVTRTADRSAVDAHWNKPSALWANQNKWVTPRDFIFLPTVSSPVSGIGHTLRWDFPQGHPIKLKAIKITFSEDEYAHP